MNIGIKSRYLGDLVLNDDREQVPFPEAVGEPHSLARMPHRMPPDPRITETVDKIPVQFPADIFNTASLPDNERLFKVGSFTLGL